MNWTEAELQAYQARQGQRTLVAVPAPTIAKTATVAPAGHSKPNKGELEYSRRLALEFPGCNIVFEGLTLRLQNGHKYTPDWIVKTPDCILCVEVKARGANGFRHPSYQRAKLAFDQSRIDFSMFKFRWAEKHKGIWDEKTYLPHTPENWHRGYGGL